MDSCVSERQLQKADILNSAIRTAQIISIQEEDLIEATRELLITISNEPFIRKGKFNDNQKYLASLLHGLSRYTNIEIADTEGNVISSAIPFIHDITISDRYYFHTVMKTGDFAVGEYQVDRIIGKPAINFAYPIVNESGKKIGLVVAIVDLEKLKNLEKRIVQKLPEGTVLTKIDHNGSILVQYPDNHNSKGQPFSNFYQFAEKIGQDHRAIWTTRINGIKYLNAYSKIESSLFPVGISLILTISETNVFKKVNHGFYRNLTFLSVLGLFMFFMASVSNEMFVVRGLNAIQKAALQLRDGNLKVRVASIKGFTEVKKLAGIFNEMAGMIELRDIQRRQKEEELQFRNAILCAQQESSIDGIMVVDENDKIVLYNQRLCSMWNISPELITKKAIEPSLLVADKVTDSQSFIHRVKYLYSHREETSQEEILLKDGRVFERYTAPMIGAGEKYFGRIWYFHDITDRKTAEVEITRINRALRMLSYTNQALIHITNEAELLNEVCRIIVEVGGYHSAWIGYAVNDEAKTLQSVAHFGIFSGYYDPGNKSWADNEFGQNPEGYTIRTGKLYVSSNISEDSLFNAWGESAIQLGYKSVITLPLINEGQTMGSIGIYSNKNNAFNSNEIEILKELTADLTFGINALRIKEMKGQAELLLRENEELLSVVFHSSPVAITIIRANDEVVVDANEILLNYWGFTRNAIIGHSNQVVKFFMNEVDHDIIIKRLLNEGIVESYEFTAVSWDNKIMFLLLSASLIKIKNEDHYILIFIDITAQKEAKKALLDSEKKYRIVADNTYNWEFWVDPENNFIYCSPSCFRITGYTSKEFIDYPGLMSEIIHPDYRSIYNNHLNQKTNYNEPITIQYKIIHKDGSEHWLEHICQLICDSEGKFLGRRGTNFDITEKKEIDRNILNTIILTEEAERNKFSNDLHDGLGPMLSIVKLCFQWISETQDSEKQKIIIGTGLKNIDEAIQEIREISTLLSPRILTNMGLIYSINQALSLINSTSKLQIDFTYDYERRYNSQVEITLYRIVCELLNNTIKHARARKVDINLSNYNNYIKLTYSDDGIGFNFNKVHKNNKGMGLHNMIQRVSTLQGFINFDTDEGKHLTITIELPIINGNLHEQN